MSLIGEIVSEEETERRTKYYTKITVERGDNNYIGESHSKNRRKKRGVLQYAIFYSDRVRMCSGRPKSLKFSNGSCATRGFHTEYHLIEDTSNSQQCLVGAYTPQVEGGVANSTCINTTAEMGAEMLAEMLTVMLTVKLITWLETFS